MVKIEVHRKGENVTLRGSREYKENRENAPWLVQNVQRDVDFYIKRGYNVKVNGKAVKTSSDVGVNKNGFISADPSVLSVRFRK
jgi:hypothetical protein